MTEEWGPWIEHDGKGCPCVGQMVEIERRNGEMVGPYIAHSMKVGAPRPGTPEDDNWVHMPKPRDVMRYRIRKPRGLTILENLIADLPEEVHA